MMLEPRLTVREALYSIAGIICAGFGVAILMGLLFGSISVTLFGLSGPTFSVIAGLIIAASLIYRGLRA